MQDAIIRAKPLVKELVQIDKAPHKKFWVPKEWRLQPQGETDVSINIQAKPRFYTIDVDNKEFPNVHYYGCPLLEIH